MNNPTPSVRKAGIVDKEGKTSSPQEYGSPRSIPQLNSEPNDRDSHRRGAFSYCNWVE